jgi:hypothetical protein
MRILFLCGSLEPGRDGVGDYTRRLACELIKKGHEACAIAIYDTLITPAIETSQSLEGTDLTILRISSACPSAERSFLIKTKVESYNPEWVSLQYVPYSFHPKGLPFGLGKSLEKLTKGKKWHIMFHETWVGFSKVAPLKHKLTGFFQRYIAKSVYISINPKIVTTSNRLYQLLLSENEIPNSILTLFSNIPIAKQNNLFISKVFEVLGLKQTERESFFIAGIFGTLYPDAKLEDILSKEFVAAKMVGKQLVVIGFGRIDAHGSKEFERLSLAFSGKVKFKHLGEQPSENISNLISIMDIAISCTPEQYLTKSGVFAAMKLHGLKVKISKGKIIPEYENEILNFNRNLISQPASRWSVEHIAEKFITLLGSIK